VEGTVTWDQVALQLFAVRRLEHVRPRDLGGAFTLDLQPGGSGTVTNGTTLPVRGAYLTRGGRYCWLGELKPGASRTVKAAEWQKKLSQRLPDKPTAGEVHEAITFREKFDHLWSGARDLLEPTTSKETWLVAEVEGFTGGMQVAEVPFNNRAALVLVRGLNPPLAQSARR
jgi:hypothetical protein